MLSIILCDSNSTNAGRRNAIIPHLKYLSIIFYHLLKEFELFGQFPTIYFQSDAINRTLDRIMQFEDCLSYPFEISDYPAKGMQVKFQSILESPQKMTVFHLFTLLTAELNVIAIASASLHHSCFSFAS
jgi:hypothetical protein